MRTLMRDKPMWIQFICYMIFGFIAAVSFTLAYFVIKDVIREIRGEELSDS